MFRASIVRHAARQLSNRCRSSKCGSLSPLLTNRRSKIVNAAIRGAISTTIPSSIDASQVSHSETRRPHSNARTNHPSVAPRKSVTISERRPFQKLMAANRGEIATRISRAASELGVDTVGIYSFEGELNYEIKILHLESNAK